MSSQRYQSQRRGHLFSLIDDVFSRLFHLAILAAILFYVLMNFLIYCISTLLSLCIGAIWFLLSPLVSVLGISSSSSLSSSMGSEGIVPSVGLETSSWSSSGLLFSPFRLLGTLSSWMLSPTVLVSGLLLLLLFALTESEANSQKTKTGEGNGNNNKIEIQPNDETTITAEQPGSITRAANALFAKMRMRTCVVAAHCEGNPVFRGIECESSNEKHFFCIRDFIEYVESEDKHPSGKIVYDPELGECKIVCPCCSTSQADPPSNFSRALALEAIGSLKFYKIETKCRERFNDDARRTTVEDLHTTNPMDIHKRQIIHNLAVNKCPKCYEGFDLFSGCAVVTCARPLCQAIFCGLCLELLVKDTSHEHVKSCPQNRWNKGSYSIPEENLVKIHRKRKAKSVQAYLKTLSKGTQASLIADSEVAMLLTNLELIRTSFRWGFFSRHRRASSVTDDHVADVD